MTINKSTILRNAHAYAKELRQLDSSLPYALALKAGMQQAWAEAKNPRAFKPWDRIQELLKPHRSTTEFSDLNPNAGLVDYGTTDRISQQVMDEVCAFFGLPTFPEQGVDTTSDIQFTRTELDTAHRTARRKAHPDMGGSSEEFLNVDEMRQHILFAVQHVWMTPAEELQYRLYQWGDVEAAEAMNIMVAMTTEVLELPAPTPTLDESQTSTSSTRGAPVTDQELAEMFGL